MTERQADLIEAVIRETLDALELDDERHGLGLAVAAAALRRAAAEDLHDDTIVWDDHHQPPTVGDQQR